MTQHQRTKLPGAWTLLGVLRAIGEIAAKSVPEVPPRARSAAVVAEVAQRVLAACKGCAR